MEEHPPSPDQVIDKLRELVSTTYLDQDIAAIHIRAMALIGRLKSLNRAANTGTRVRKDATARARHEMDQSHLGLQNLLYEKRHLEREIEKCRQFACVFARFISSCVNVKECCSLVPSIKTYHCIASTNSRGAHPRKPEQRTFSPTNTSSC